jgi:hypothetical protein
MSTPQAQNKCQIGGIVTDGDGNGLMNADVAVIGTTDRTQTTGQGHFCLSRMVITETVLGLRISKEGYRPWIENIRVPDTDLRVTLNQSSVKNRLLPTPQPNKHRMVIIQQEAHKPQKQ